jgi:hypothetical protein
MDRRPAQPRRIKAERKSAAVDVRASQNKRPALNAGLFNFCFSIRRQLET